MRRLASLPQDEQGTISILSVITIFGLTIVLGMVINAGRQVQDKIRLQNAADAATYSGAAAVARGMNALAFSNHIEAEVFALTAYLRTGREMSPSRNPRVMNILMAILDAWENVGRMFLRAPLLDFRDIGKSILKRVPIERDAVKYFLRATELQSATVMPVFEFILRGPTAQPGGPPDPLGGAIPRFQRSVVLTTPKAAQEVANEVARLHGNMVSQGNSTLERLHGKRPLTAVLWRTNGLPISFGDERDPIHRTLPVFDPTPTGPDHKAFSRDYFELARCQRRRWAAETLKIWNQYQLDLFCRGIPHPTEELDHHSSPRWGGIYSAKMSTLYAIWETNTCAQLNELLDVEYPATNLPYVSRLAGPHFEKDRQCETCSADHAGIIDCNCMEGIREIKPPDSPKRPPGYRHYVYQNLDLLQNSARPSLLEQYHSFVGVVYWPHLTQTSPLFFRYPLNIDSMAYAQASVFIPRKRYHKRYWVSPGPFRHLLDRGWFIDHTEVRPGKMIPTDYLNAIGEERLLNEWSENNYDNWPQEWDPDQPVHPVNLQWVPQWDIGNQNWSARLVPATSDNLPAILQSPLARKFAPDVHVPNLGGISAAQLRRVNTH